MGIGRYSAIPHLTPALSAPGGGEGEGARAGGDEFSSLAAAEAWLAGAAQATGPLPRARLAAAILRAERAYDQFPELLVRFPRRALLRPLRAAADALPDGEAIPLLLLLCAAEPSDPASLAGLFERTARAHGGASLLRLVRLFRPYAELGWEAIGPAVAALSADRTGAAALREILSEALKTGHPPESAAALGRVLAPLLLAEPAAIDPAILAQAAASARRHLVEAPAGNGGAARRHDRLALAERLKIRLQPPAPPAGPAPEAARPARPGGEIGFAAFLAQWPELAIEVPAAALHGHAVLGPDGVLRAERHDADIFCSGPSLNLPAGRYRVRIIGEAAAGAEYSARALCRLGERAVALLCERRHVRGDRIAGTLAELAFASDIALRDFQVVIGVTSRAAAFAIASLTITADRLRPDPEG